MPDDIINYPDLRRMRLLSPAEDVMPPGIVDTIDQSQLIQSAQNPVVPKVQAPVVSLSNPTQPGLLPHEKAMSDLVPSVPLRSNYKPTLRSGIADILLGAVTGALHKPYKSLEDTAYERDLQDYQNKFGVNQNVSKVEESGRTFGQKLASEQNKINTTNANIQNRTDTTNANIASREKINRDRIAEQEKLAQNRKTAFGEKLAVLQKQLLDGDITPEEYKTQFDRILGSTQSVQNFEAKQQVRKNTAKDISEQTSLGKVTEPVIAGEAKKAAATKGASTQAGLSVENKPENVEGTAARKAAETAAAESARIKTQQSNLDNIIAQYNAMLPEKKGEFYDKLPVKDKSAILRDPRFIFGDAVLNPQDQAAIAVARTSLNHIDNIRTMFDDPVIQNHIGALSGRILKGESVIGGDLMGANEDENRKLQDFLTTSIQLLGWEARNLGGTRPAYQLFNTLKSTAPGETKGLGSNKGALDALERSAIANINARIGSRPNQSPKVNPPKKVSDLFEVVK